MSTVEHSTSKPGLRSLVRWLYGGVGPLVGLLAVVLFFAVADALRDGPSTFASAATARTVAVQSATVAVAALGMTLIIIAGGIDLSAGTALALSATVLAWCLREGYGVPVALLACVGTGALCGLINGALITALRIVPFIATLGTMTVYLGIAKLVAEETTVRPSPSQVPEWLGQLDTVWPDPLWLAWPVLPNFAPFVWYTLLLAALLAIMLRCTVFGRHVFAVGSNEAMARLCGVNVTLVKIAVYTLGGVFIGIAGINQFALLTQGEPTTGLGLELKFIAAVVIGGGSLSGGRGSVLGTLAGAALTAVILMGCTHLGVSDPVNEIILGLIIVGAAGFDRLRQTRLVGKYE